MISKINNQKGSILQIVLVIFMVLNIFLLSIGKIIIENARTIQRITELDKTRIIELSIIYNFKQMTQHNTLFSNRYFIDEIEIVYNVETIENKHHITTTVNIPDNSFDFYLILCQDTLDIEEFEYQ